VATDGEEADVKARTTQYDVVILDIMLPKIDGLTLLKKWRTDGIKTHVLMLTARGTTTDKVAGLDIGADDYLTKPVDLDELFARVRALVRRAGQQIHLTPREYALLEFLAFHRGKVVTRSMIWEHLYDEYDENTSNVVDVYIRYLRNKIDKGYENALILTKWGEGYMLRGADDLDTPAEEAAVEVAKAEKPKKK